MIELSGLAEKHKIEDKLHHGSSLVKFYEFIRKIDIKCLLAEILEHN